MSQENPGYTNLANLKMLEGLYERWLSSPASVDPSWKNFFEGMEFASQLPKALPPREESGDLRVYNLIRAYRTYGHLMAQCDPLAAEPPSLPHELKLENFGLSEKDKETLFPTGGFLNKDKASLREILDGLQKTYCQTIGIEYMDLGSVEIEQWVQKKIEPFFPTHITDKERMTILTQLNQAEGFETFLHTKYVGQKRFSLEGAETFISILHAILDTGAEEGVTDVVMGMAHRGRLNVLSNIMGKSYEYIFEEFEDYYTPELAESSGDVKYHMGFTGTYATMRGKKIQVMLAANPSHLEAVDPIVLGSARAIQEQKKAKAQRKEVVAILIHGDAAVAGQGVIYESLGLSRLNGYETKGTIHLVINNQIGFTTLPKEGRSTRYCTDIAKAFGAPVLHVNGEDPEACVAAARLATELRQQFGCDVFIDLIGYRKYGHNEGDEPSFTQPLQYQLIRSKKTIREIYRDRLIETGVIGSLQAEEMEKEFHAHLNQELQAVKSKNRPETLRMRQQGRHLPQLFASVSTRVDKQVLVELGLLIAKVPDSVNLHPKVLRLLKDRQNMVSGDENTASIDWGMGELLAYGSLCTEGIHLRLSGQDVRRGTFSHRHALYVDQLNSAHYFPLSHLKEGQARFDVFNSSLSEYAVLGFEFGYSLLYNPSLVLWEAQFGDFANGAQIIIDQFISTAEMKWGQMSNLTLLLPHGYEGMGPEHSSARIERFLQGCADENITVANPTLPAQFFHLLRRQALRSLKKPLIVFTPKALLRHPLCRSPLKAFYREEFQEILNDPTPPQGAKRLLLCSGKIAFDLLQERDKRKSKDVIVRIEQLYPLHEAKLLQIFHQYPEVQECLYLQEEHENMGAWPFLRPHLERLLERKIPLTYVGRAPAAVTAAGSHALHKLEQEAILKKLFSEGQPK